MPAYRPKNWFEPFVIFPGLRIPAAGDRQNVAVPFRAGSLFVVRQRHGARKVKRDPFSFDPETPGYAL
jgi:hypothetical protein